MYPKRKRPSSEDDETRTLLRPEKRSRTEDIEVLSEEVRRRLKVDDSTSTQAGPASAPKGTRPSSSRVERKEGSGFMDKRTVVWEASLRQCEVVFGTLIVPVRSAGVLYSSAERLPRGRKNTRLATVEDDEGRSWKMVVEHRNHKLILYCDKYLKQNGLQPNDKICLCYDSHSRYHISFVKLRETSFPSSGKKKE